MVEEKKIAAYGIWVSPITAELVAGSSLKFHEVHINVRILVMQLQHSM